jgi:hypothetical protein
VSTSSDPTNLVRNEPLGRRTNMKSRFYASPSDDENGRTWDVLRRGDGKDKDPQCVQQQIQTRAAARKAAKRWEAETASVPSLEYFTDPVTGERFDDDEKVDVHDRDLIGSDDDGTWWGTSRAVYVLSQGTTVVHVQGNLGSTPWQGWFASTRDEAVAYATKRGVTGTQTEESALGATAWIDQ